MANDPDTSDTLNYSAADLPTGLSVNPDTGFISGTTNVANTFNPTMTVEDGKGGSDSASITWTVNTGGNSGNLVANTSSISANVDLTTEGEHDWAHWSGGSVNFNRKAGALPQISDFTLIGSETPVGAGTSASYSWLDGSPIPSDTQKNGLRVFNVGSGFHITVAADTTPRTLRFYVGAKNATGQFTATLSDASAPAFTTLINQSSGLGSHIVTLNYQAASAGQTLIIEYTLNKRFKNNLMGSQINLEAATLVGEPSIGSLSGTISNAVDNVNLTTEGTADWGHWSGGTVNFIRKAGVLPQISDFTLLGNETPLGAGTRANYIWSDGTPIPSDTEKNGLRVFNVGSGFRVTVAADTAPRTLRFYIGTKNARGQFTSTLSDDSAAPYNVLIEQPKGLGTHVVTLNYQAASAGQTLNIEYHLDTRFKNNLTGSQINLEAVTLE